MKKPVLAGVIVVAIILGIIAYSTMQSFTSNRVEVCMVFNGVTNCKIARGATQEDAIRTATSNACGEIAGGVTDTMACLRAEPSKLNVLK
ncbi:MAG: hypothetical protein ABIR70_11165 [Bryobacteraceae bacterium]